jgi:colicin import membrane protein
VLRGVIYSKLSTEKWPRVDKLVKRIEACIQSDLWSQHEQQLAEADAAMRTAEAQREAAAAAAERAQLEEEQVLVARRQLEALRAAAESGTDAAAAEDARARLAVFEQRLTKEAAEAAEAMRTAQELAATAEATWSVAQAKAALHTAKREGGSAVVKAAEDNLEAAQAALVADTKEVRAAALNLKFNAVNMNSASTC